MSGVVVDTSVWVDFLAGRSLPVLDDALAAGSITLPPIVVAELVTGAGTARDRTAIGELLQDLSLHRTPLGHWLAVGDLRRHLAGRGVAVSIPDAHVAQCALELDAVLLTRDAVFTHIARHTALRVG